MALASVSFVKSDIWRVSHAELGGVGLRRRRGAVQEQIVDRVGRLLHSSSIQASGSRMSVRGTLPTDARLKEFLNAVFSAPKNRRTSRSTADLGILRLCAKRERRPERRRGIRW